MKFVKRSPFIEPIISRYEKSFEVIRVVPIFGKTSECLKQARCLAGTEVEKVSSTCGEGGTVKRLFKLVLMSWVYGGKGDRK